MKRDIFDNKPLPVAAPKDFPELHDFSEVNELSKSVFENISKTLDNYAIEGLRRKGFEFSGKWELEQFVKERCRCADHVGIRERTYYVDDIPFLLHKYGIRPIKESVGENGEKKFAVESGGFFYL